MVGNMKRYRHAAVASALLSLFGAGAAHAQAPQSVFAPAGPVARTQGALLSLTLCIAIGIFVVVGRMLIYTLIRFRGAAGRPRFPSRCTATPRWK